MKLLSVAKKIKFPDLRKYFSLNLISLLGYVILFCFLILSFVDFPPAIFDNSYGEPNYMYSSEESLIIDLLIFSIGLSLFLFLLLFLEIIFKLIFKLLYAKNLIKKPVSDIPVPKILELIYTIFFSIGLLLVIIPLFLSCLHTIFLY